VNEPRSVSRLALGLAALAADRVNAGRPGRNGLALGVGVAQQSATAARRVVGAVTAPGTRIARRASRAAAALPGAGLVTGPLERARARLALATDEARHRGSATVGLGRSEAQAFLRRSVADGVDWAQREVVPPIVDGLVPHLVSKTLPRLIDGAMPEIRLRVLPVVVDDLTTDPKIRGLVAEQGRGMIGDAAHELRDSSANADDRVESAFLRLLRRPPRSPTTSAGTTGVRPTPVPGSPAPAAPEPESPIPVSPAPLSPSPVAPVPGEPQPADPVPGQPGPEYPVPVSPAPVGSGRQATGSVDNGRQATGPAGADRPPTLGG
jgi:hypothetical protein